MTATPPPDGAPDQAAPTSRPSRWWFVLGLAVGLVIFGGGYTVFWLLQHADDNITKPVQAATSAFFEAVVSGDDAYGQLCAVTSSYMTREQFERNQSIKRLTAYELVGTDVGRTTVTVTVELTYANGNVETHLVPIAIENETWKVCGYPY